MRGVLTVVFVVGIGLTPLTAGAENILILKDLNSENLLAPDLVNAGHTVFFSASAYWVWYGDNPSTAGIDVVIFPNAVSSTLANSLKSTAELELAGFLRSGGTLVMTEWMAYDVCMTYKPNMASFMPVESTPGCTYGDFETWVVTEPNHPLTSGLPATWDDGAGWSDVIPKAGSYAVVTGSINGNPMVTYSVANGGPVIHLNHDMAYTTPGINTNAIQLILNAVDLSGTFIFADGFETLGNIGAPGTTTGTERWWFPVPPVVP